VVVALQPANVAYLAGRGLMSMPNAGRAYLHATFRKLVSVSHRAQGAGRKGIFGRRR